jgi:SAM-dependent methyltransferase
MSLNKISIERIDQCGVIHDVEAWQSHGHCLACGSDTEWMVDDGFQDQLHLYREGIRCTQCNLISRQRAIMYYLRRLVRPGNCIYFQEQLSATFQLAQNILAQCQVIGSEYTELPGCRHENVEQLTFADRSIDIIVSQDVFEHVSKPWQGFTECFRVLRPGGHMLMTVPFAGQPTPNSIDRRAAALPDFFHGDPHSDHGVLVYTDFGWDINQRLQDCGFLVRLVAVGSAQYGHPGPILLWHLTRPEPA